MNIGIIKTPLGYGAGTRGTGIAPMYLIDNNLVERLTDLGHSVSTSLCRIAEHRDEEIGKNPKAKYLEPIILTNTDLALRVDTCYSAGDFPLVLGGDHSILLGSLAGISTAVKRKGRTLGVLYVDAHADFNTSNTTPSGNIHGECLAASCGMGVPELCKIYTDEVKMDPTNVCIVGARALDSGEKRILHESGVKVFTATDVELMGLKAVLDQAIDYLQSRVDNIHLSFDVDAVDPLYAPGTGIHIPGGLTYREAIAIADTLSSNPRLISADVVEFNPLRDIDGRTGNLCLDFITHLFGATYY